MLKKTLLIIAAATAALLSQNAGASEGVIELNQTCAVSTGCLPGDTPGFPITIQSSAPKSFKLTSNLTVSTAGTMAILGRPSFASIDLAGFTIEGPNTCFPNSTSKGATCAESGSGWGVNFEAANYNGVIIENGTIRGFRGICLNLAGRRSTVRNLRIEDCSGEGVHLGQDAIAERMSVTRTGDVGIYANERSIIRNSTVGWSLIGIEVAEGSRVEGSKASQNRESGFVGETASSFQGNDSSDNGEFGISITGDGGFVKDNTLRSNELGGINVRSVNVIESNMVLNSGTVGIYGESGNVISGNTVSGSGEDGVFATDGTAIRGNSVYNNGTTTSHDGIHCTLGCTVQDNTIRGNAGHGLRFDSSSSVYSGNAIGANYQDGIVINGRDAGQNVCGTTIGCQ